jgi:hypothetical protein
MINRAKAKAAASVAASKNSQTTQMIDSTFHKKRIMKPKVIKKPNILKSSKTINKKNFIGNQLT